jgi:hypothetical protein
MTTRQAVLLTLLVLAAVAAPGCLKNDALAEGRMDEVYRPSVNRWPEAEPIKLTVAGRPVPSRLTLTREHDLLSSVLDIVKAREKVFSESRRMQLLVADDLGDMLAGILRDMAERTRGWAESSDDYAKTDGREKWAGDTAGILSLLYRIDRGRAVADPREALDPERSRWAAVAPVLRSVITVMMHRMELETGDQGLLSALEDQRSLPVAFVLRGAFRLASLEMPADAPATVLEVFDHGPPTAVGVENVLRRRLLELRDKAEEGRRPPSSKKMTRYLKAVPILLRNIARGVEQWDKFYLASAEIGTTGSGPMLSLVADVQPGQVVRIDAVHKMAPLVTLEGRTRVNLWQTSEPDGGPKRVHVQFVDERGGRVAVRFESWVYGLVSLFAFPIEDWGLDELVITRTRPERHRREMIVDMMMTARKYGAGDEDRRRMIRLRTVRRLEVTTTGDTVDRRVRTDLRFEYWRPDRMWYYDRTSYKVLPKL